MTKTAQSHAALACATALALLLLPLIAGCSTLSGLDIFGGGGDDDSGSNRRDNIEPPTQVSTARPIGSEVLFIVNIGAPIAGLSDRQEGVFVAGSNATRVERLTDVAGVSPAFLSDGRVVYWRTEGTPGFAIIDAGQVTSLAITPEPSQGRAVGLRGTNKGIIAFTSAGSLWVVSNQGGEATAIATPAMLPAPLADGRVAYVGAQNTVHVVGADGTGDIVVCDTATPIRHLVTLPDGRLLMATYDEAKELSHLYVSAAEEGASESGVFASYGALSFYFEGELSGLQAMPDGRVAFSYGLPGGTYRGLAMGTLSVNVVKDTLGINEIRQPPNYEGLWVLDGGPVPQLP